MGKAKRQAQLCSSSYDTSSSSDLSDNEHPSLDAGRYQKANMQQGFRTRQFRLTAVRELHDVLAQGWSSAGKKVQAAVFDDVLVAVQQPDSRPEVIEAVTALVAVAKRVLPQQKRNQLVKLQRSAAVAASRTSRKHADSLGCAIGTGCHAGEEEDAVVALGDVPLEVVRGILQALDPLSLAAAACVCRAWRGLATDDGLWQQHLQQTFPRTAQQLLRQCGQQQQRQQQQQHGKATPGITPGSGSSSAANSCSARTQFAAAALRCPSALVPWRSCRVLAGGQLQWVPVGAAASEAAALASRAAVRGVILPGPVHVTTAQAVSWLMGSAWSQVFARGSGSSSSSAGSSDAGSSDESDGEESHSHGTRSAAKSLRLWAVSRP